MNIWHKLPPKKIFSQLKTSPKGLSAKVVASRLKRYGFNEITEVNGTKWYHILLAQFTNIMVLILFVALGVSLIVGEHIDAIAIGVIIALNAVIGFVQEFRAEKAVEALKKMAAPHAIVIRAGQTKKIDARQLVPGDIIVLEEGMQIPADARIIKAMQLQAIESSLTGESNPILKSTKLVTKHSSIGDLHNMVFMGTVISKGHGLAVVTETGMDTQFGHIAHMVQTEKTDPTPLQKKLDHLSKMIAGLVIGVALLMFALSFATDRDPVEMFMLSISLAVSVIPEGLPAIVTLTLAIGVQKIAKHNAIVRKLPAAETLGSTSVICSDKTGTLTQNQMTVQLLYVNGKQQKVTGTGYAPTGKIQGPASKELDLLIHCAALCNNASLLKSTPENGTKAKWQITGDPTEGCLLTLARKAGLDLKELEESFPRQDELVFDSDRKLMSTLNFGPDKKAILYTKGAPDSILEICTHIRIKGRTIKLSAEKRAEILRTNDQMASKAYRVLGFAYKEQKSAVKAGRTSKLKEEKMIFIGLAAMMDPARPEVKDAIKRCHSAHIEVIMITGDHALTAKAIGKQIGLFRRGEEVLTGQELEHMTDEELRRRVEKVRIFARVSPRHKVKILKALKTNGHIVAMTGDGVNDAPALKNADIGIAMGITGTDVAKEASEMILTDDNFASIVSTVESGRIIYRNLKKFIRFLLSANFDEVIVISVVFLMGLPIPFLPLQILWVNLLTDALPAIALGTDVPDEDIMKLKPRNPRDSIWHELLHFSLIAGLISAAISLFLYFQTVHTTSIEHTRTLMFTTIVVFEMMLVFSVRFAKKNYFTHFTKNKLLIFGVLLSIFLQLFAIYHPAFQSVLQTEALTATDWAWMLSLCASGIIIIEIWKYFRPAPTHV
jgi:P-type Ca2+ transporter type 2C